jgi:hypothetical protein
MRSIVGLNRLTTGETLIDGAPIPFQHPTSPRVDVEVARGRPDFSPPAGARGCEFRHVGHRLLQG